MAESETECAAPGLNTLEPECVTAHSGVSDVHTTHTSVIKTEADLGSTHTGDLIKMEILDFTELGYVTHLHPGQIKTEAGDGGYLNAEHVTELHVVECVDVKSDKMKCESSESLVSDLMSTVMDGAGVDLKDEDEPWQCAGEPISNCKKEETNSLPTQCMNNHHCDKNNENNQARIANVCINSRSKLIHCQRMNEPMVITEPIIMNSQKNYKININKGDDHTVAKPHKCTQCEKCFTKKSHLMAHLRVHTGEKPYKCTQCEKCFLNKSGLDVHLRIHTGEKPYKCAQCEKRFLNKSGLDVHLRIHTGEKPYKCTLCEKRFRTKAHLNRHQGIHTVKQPYTCTQCEECFHSKSDLNSHQIIHTGEKQNKCYEIKSHLNTQLRIYTGEKPYKCIHCGKSFSLESTLNRHERIHTGTKPYTCIQCRKCFSHIADLSVHLGQHWLRR